MEYGSIERELHVDAPPQVVFDVLTDPEHIRDWWSAEAAVLEAHYNDHRQGWDFCLPHLAATAKQAAGAR